MASRHELLMIRAARAGQSNAQLALGRRYLFGGKGLPRSPATALYWLDRAAIQQEPDAWMLIGRHVPFEIARMSARPANLSMWYERAYDAGLAQAGLVYARLALQGGRQPLAPAERRKALVALESAAQAGIADAQWLLAQQLELAHDERKSSPRMRDAAAVFWTTRAAAAGVHAAQRALAEHGWASDDCATFLRCALPLARSLTHSLEHSEFVARQLPAADVLLLSRCAQALMRETSAHARELERFLEMAAWARDRDAQFHFGLWFAKIDAQGKRCAHLTGPVHYKKAIRWLTLAGEQGLAEAWFALSRIYLKPECSQRSLADARHYMERAAEAGHPLAQAEFGMLNWRKRRERADGDIEAVLWLQKAAALEQAEAAQLLEKVAPPATPAAWAVAAHRSLTREALNQHPFMAGRIELAAVFGLSRTEALLLDIHAADRGHCLLIDMRAERPRSARRLISLCTAAERQALDRILRLFENVDCGPQGPEGCFRQRVYRLKSLAA
jgi:TPR repeat protein